MIINWRTKNKSKSQCGYADYLSSGDNHRSLFRIKAGRDCPGIDGESKLRYTT